MDVNERFNLGLEFEVILARIMMCDFRIGLWGCFLGVSSFTGEIGSVMGTVTQEASTFGFSL